MSVLKLTHERSVKHSHLFKSEVSGDNTNSYVSKKFLGENPPKELWLTTIDPKTEEK